jgi:hypothetical protein
MRTPTEVGMRLGMQCQRLGIGVRAACVTASSVRHDPRALCRLCTVQLQKIRSTHVRTELERNGEVVLMYSPSGTR